MVTITMESRAPVTAGDVGDRNQSNGGGLMPIRSLLNSRSPKLALLTVLVAGGFLGSTMLSSAEVAGSAAPPSVPTSNQTEAKTNGTPSVSALLGSDLSNLPELGSNFASFSLDNGMQVVVIPDHRAPVVTHMVWYKVGAADEEPGKSGIAHFLEHLMFKGTPAHPDGEFSKIVASIGGQENAFTSQDYTAYFQRVAKQHLRLMMELEADRMINLELRKEQVEPELQVILEERASRIDNNPAAQLGEALGAALYRNHPYGIPIIGWEHEMKGLNREIALDFYKKFYTPNNAILIVAGDVTPDAVKALAKETYGKIAKRADIAPRIRVSEPPQRTARTVTLRHERVREPSVRRSYMTPSETSAAPGEAEALDILGYILGSGTNSRLYQSLVIKQKVATSAGAFYMSGGLDDTSFLFYGSPAEGKNVEDVLDAIKGEIAKLIADGVTDEEMQRAKRSMLADGFFAQDNQATLARIVGTNLTSGSTLERIKSWPQRLAGATADQVVTAAKTYFQEHRSVTGYLLPPEAEKMVKASDADAKAAQPMEAKSDAGAVSDTKADPALDPVQDKDAVTLPGPKARKMSMPKHAPKDSSKVPAPQSRPQGHPKPKPSQKTEIKG
ncbi:M16 family metallopeptidase [Cohaesibacter intestini]|uniref:M16 family metallopeptidase n=1 Tax=Cohaesibacter intestini TaxID=2211145 RepID=UPI000DEB35C0|nr:pitrilysin family protein [Cohaesibacter intestini]